MPACAFRFPPPAWVRLARALSVPVMFWSLATLAGISSCGGPSAAQVSDSLRTRVRALDDHPIVVERELLEPAAVRAYYAKHPSRAWPGARVAQVVEAIRGV
jgi:hypothetical protein